MILKWLNKKMVTKEKFEAYRKIQLRGNYNMVMDAEIVRKKMGIPITEYVDILKNYGKYIVEFNIK